MAEGEIFVSHASQDYAAIVDPLIDLIHAGLGPNVGRIFCSNAPGLDIPPGVGFLQYVQDCLRRAALTIHVITPAFLDSQYCLLELGAAWERGTCFPLVVPPVPISQLQRGPLADLQFKRLNDQGLDSLRDKIGDVVGIEHKVARWTDRRNNFLLKLASILTQGRPFTRMVTTSVRGHHMEAWKIDESGTVFHRWWPGDREAENWAWHEWIEFPTPGECTDVAAVSAGPEHAMVFVRERRGYVWQREWNLNSNWSGWHRLDGVVQGPLSATSFEEGHIELFAQSMTGSDLVNRWSWNWSGWNGWWNQLS